MTTDNIGGLGPPSSNGPNSGVGNIGKQNRGDYNACNFSWGIGCTQPPLIPCFDGEVFVRPTDQEGVAIVSRLAAMLIDNRQRGEQVLDVVQTAVFDTYMARLLVHFEIPKDKVNDLLEALFRLGNVAGVTHRE